MMNWSTAVCAQGSRRTLRRTHGLQRPKRPVLAVGGGHNHGGLPRFGSRAGRWPVCPFGHPAFEQSQLTGREPLAFGGHARGRDRPMRHARRGHLRPDQTARSPARPNRRLSRPTQRASSRSPPRCFSGPWHFRHPRANSGRICVAKSTGCVLSPGRSLRATAMRGRATAPMTASDEAKIASDRQCSLKGSG